MMTNPNKIFPMEFVAIGLVAVILLFIVLSSLSEPMSEWDKIAKDYPRPSHLEDALETYHYQSMGKGILFGKQRRITVGIHPSGIEIGKGLFVTKSLFIPWESVSEVRSGSLGITSVIDLGDHSFWLTGKSTDVILSKWKRKG